MGPWSQCYRNWTGHQIGEAQNVNWTGNRTGTGKKPGKNRLTKNYIKYSYFVKNIYNNRTMEQWITTNPKITFQNNNGDSLTKTQ